MSRYAIWDKMSPIITPIGEVFTAEQWIERYPVAGVDSITVVCSGGEINGGFFGTLGALVQQYQDMGADFSEAQTDEDKLRIIEAFEDELNTPPEVSNEELTATSLASIAAALDFQNLLSLPDEEEEI